MHILVCAKQVLDPDGVNSYALWGRLDIDDSGRGFETGGAIPHIINAYDEQATEAALRIRDAGVDCSITVAVAGDESAASILRRLVAMGADRAVHVKTDGAGTDGFRTASILAGLVRELGDVDLVLCGRQGSDYDQGTVPAVLAERLGWSYVTPATDVSVGDSARVTRVTPLGDEIVEAKLPAVVAVSNEVGQPRYPSSRRMMAARRTPPEVFEASTLSPDGEGAAVELVELLVPQVQGQCVIIEGDGPASKAEALLARLAESGALDG
jgi:electron transfer flavoprotein beta subunit